MSDVKTALPEDADLECFLPVNIALRFAEENLPSNVNAARF